MIRSALAAAFFAATSWATQAQATSIVYTFAGTVDKVAISGYTGTTPASGETLSGSLTVNLPASWDSVNTDGRTFTQNSDSNGQVGLASGILSFSGGTTITLDNGAPNDLVLTVMRGYRGQDNGYGIAVDALSAGAYSLVQLELFDNAGAASSLFADPAGGLSFAQAVDLTGEQQLTGFGVLAADGSYYQGSFTLTSLTISAVPEPANIALLLAGAGLVGLGARRRRQAGRVLLSAS